MKKKILTMIMAVCMVAGVLSASAFAIEEGEEVVITAEDCTCNALCTEPLPENMELPCPWCLLNHTQCAYEQEDPDPIVDDDSGEGTPTPCAKNEK